MSDKARCWACHAADGPFHEVKEVWFEILGMEGQARFCSTKDLKGPLPLMCSACKKGRAHELASTVLMQAYDAGRTGPLWPATWWVRYDEGVWPPHDCIGGDVGPRPDRPPAVRSGAKGGPP